MQLGKRAPTLPLLLAKGKAISDHYRVPPPRSSSSPFLDERSKELSHLLRYHPDLSRIAAQYLACQCRVLFHSRHPLTPDTLSGAFITHRPNYLVLPQSVINARHQKTSRSPASLSPQSMKTTPPPFFPGKLKGEPLLCNLVFMKTSHVLILNKDDFALTITLPFCKGSAKDREFGFGTREGAVGSSRASR